MMLQKTILSTADVARLFNVTETTVKRWANDGTLKCMKTPGGHRKFEMRNVVEFAAEMKFEPSGALTLSSEDELARTIQVAILARDFSVLREAFLEKALSQDKRDLFVFFSYLYQHRIQSWEIFDLVIAPGMKVIGQRWLEGQLSIEQEHRASYETMDAITKLQTQIHFEPEKGLTVVCACPGEEQHEIGLRCASYMFESEGWLSHYLGARTPYTSIVNAVREMKPQAICLSVTMPVHEPASVQGFRDMLVTLKGMGTNVLVGGSGVRTSSDLLNGFVSTSSSALELLTFIKKFEDPANAQ